MEQRRGVHRAARLSSWLPDSRRALEAAGSWTARVTASHRGQKKRPCAQVGRAAATDGHSEGRLMSSSSSTRGRAVQGGGLRPGRGGRVVRAEEASVLVLLSDFGCTCVICRRRPLAYILRSAWSRTSSRHGCIHSAPFAESSSPSTRPQWMPQLTSRTPPRPSTWRTSASSSCNAHSSSAPISAADPEQTARRHHHLPPDRARPVPPQPDHLCPGRLGHRQQQAELV